MPVVTIGEEKTMNLRSRRFSTVILLALVAVSTPALSQETSWYAGLGLGQASHDVECSGTTTCDDKDTAWKIFGGYQFNKNLGVEAGYTNLGKPSLGDAISTTTIKVKGFEVLAVGTLPINQQFDIYGKAGFFRWDLDVSDNVFGSISESGTDLTFGIGAKYNFSKSLGIRLEWQRYNDIGNETTTGKSDSDFIGIGIVFKF
jgi:OOP family OmpA-OmpF porin